MLAAAGTRSAREARQEGPPPAGLQLPPRLQEVAQRDEIDRLGAVGKLNHGAKNLAVGFPIEILRCEQFKGVIGVVPFILYNLPMRMSDLLLATSISLNVRIRLNFPSTQCCDVSRDL